MITAGLGGAERHGSVALAEGARVMGVCQQERVTRVRNAGFNPSGLPDEALDALLRCHGRSRDDVGRYVVAGTNGQPRGRTGSSTWMIISRMPAPPTFLRLLLRRRSSCAMVTRRRSASGRAWAIR